MKEDSLIVTINEYKDIKKLEKINPKYINLSLSSLDIKIINYFMKNGSNYSFSDCIANKRGYIYVDYSIFYRAQLIVNNIIFNVDEDLTELEKARYLYIKLGSLLGSDINTMPSKNNNFNFNNINTINNIWGSLYNEKGTNISITKLYLYMCSLLNIKCEVVMTSDDGYLCNKLTINDRSFIVDLSKDIPFIQAKFKTKYFDIYNSDLPMDRKINYINKKYNDDLLEDVLKDFDYHNSNLLESLLLKSEEVIDVRNIKPIELSTIYQEIFDKYCPNYDIIINNLYYVEMTNRNHFILFSYDNEHFSFNYNKNTFIKISSDSINKSIEENIIGIYLEEEIPNLRNRAIC